MRSPFPKDSFVRQIALVLIFLVVALFLVEVVHVLVAELRAKAAVAQPGEVLQSITGLIGNLVGALLSGFLAAGAAYWVLYRERDIRIQEAAARRVEAGNAVLIWALGQANRLTKLLTISQTFGTVWAEYDTYSRNENGKTAAIARQVAEIENAPFPEALRDRVGNDIPTASTAVQMVEHYLTQATECFSTGATASQISVDRPNQPGGPKSGNVMVNLHRVRLAHKKYLERTIAEVSETEIAIRVLSIVIDSSSHPIQEALMKLRREIRNATARANEIGD